MRKGASKKKATRPRAKTPPTKLRRKSGKPTVARPSQTLKPAAKALPRPRPENVQALLKLRRTIANRRPAFQRQESWRYRRIPSSWRKPKGVDSKMRLSVKGWPKRVKVGYRGPASVRDFHPSGKRDVLVHNVSELEKLSSERDAARLAATLGARKREQIVSRARELGIRILNPQGLRPLKTGE